MKCLFLGALWTPKWACALGISVGLWPPPCVCQHCCLLVNRVMNLWWIWLSILWEAFAESGLHWSFVPCLGDAPATHHLLLASIQAKNWMNPLLGSAGLKKLMSERHSGHGQLSGAWQRLWHFPSLCFSVREAEFNLLVNISGGEIHFCSVCLDCSDTRPCRHPLHPLAARCSGAE